MISVGGGLQLPLMEGDKIRIGTRDSKNVYYWLPLNKDGKTLDLSRANKGDRAERYLYPRFFERLLLGNNLMSVNKEEFVIRSAEPNPEPAVANEAEPEEPWPKATEKRRPLLLFPTWGLPPQWH
jgi:hypothetical protein